MPSCLEAAMAMLPLLFCPLLAGWPAQEPDGSRTLGIVPPFRGEPAPPAWLRADSHALAAALGPLTRHYVYEAYGDGCGGWLVRYLSYPGCGEPCGEPQVALLFGPDRLEPPRRIHAGDLQVEARRAWWESRLFVLVDHRDLVRDWAPVPRRR